MNERDDKYVRQLEDALAVMWDLLDPGDAEAVGSEVPELFAFVRTVRSLVGERESQW